MSDRSFFFKLLPCTDEVHTPCVGRRNDIPGTKIGSYIRMTALACGKNPRRGWVSGHLHCNTVGRRVCALSLVGGRHFVFFALIGTHKQEKKREKKTEIFGRTASAFLHVRSLAFTLRSEVRPWPNPFLVYSRRSYDRIFGFTQLRSKTTLYPLPCKFILATLLARKK